MPSVPIPDHGEYLLARKRDPHDPVLGGFTFKRWDRTPKGDVLSPVTKDPKFKPIPLGEEDEKDTRFLARFIEVLHLDDSDVRA